MELRALITTASSLAAELSIGDPKIYKQRLKSQDLLHTVLFVVSKQNIYRMKKQNIGRNTILMQTNSAICCCPPNSLSSPCLGTPTKMNRGEDIEAEGHSGGKKWKGFPSIYG
jgi:hypothetical protein